MSFPANRSEVEGDAELATTAGFDSLATGDHLRHPRDASIPVLDGWAVVSAWTMCTTGLRIAMLVTNLIYRHPVLVAKAAVAADQLSGGRLDLGVGAGVYATDHQMAGVPAWSPSERFHRFADFVDTLEAALAGRPSFQSPAYRFTEAAWSPGAIQHPRPRLWIGAAGPKVLRLAAEHADGWSAFGGYTPTDHAGFFSIVADQRHTIDEACHRIGRDPVSLARSLLAFRPLAPWSSPDALIQVVTDAHKLGFEEVILYKPATPDEWRTFESAPDTIAELKAL